MAVEAAPTRNPDRFATRAAVAAAVGTVALLVLAATGAARPTPALVAAAAVAVAGAWLAYGSRPPGKIPPPTRSETPAPAARPEPDVPFAEILEQLSDPILLVSAGRREDPSARRFLFANGAARALLRIQRPDGPLATAIRSPEVLAAVDEALFGVGEGSALLALGGVQDQIWRAWARGLNGAEHPAATPMALLRLRDETEFHRSERTRADFLANASHELRTPLASLTGFIETLRGHARDDVAARERFLAIMQSQADRMGRLVDALMSLSRIELAEHIRPSDQVDVALAAGDVMDALALMAAEKRVNFRQDLPAPGAAVAIGDRDQIVQVIQNLAENALKYTPAGGEVSVEARAGLTATECLAGRGDGGAQLSLLVPDHAVGVRYVSVTVADAGPGIARSHLPRLTQRFYRVEGQKSGERAGAGLGLAIVKHILNRHRGGLLVESTEAVGSRFTAFMPMASEDPGYGRT